jgi:hypothetical protein
VTHVLKHKSLDSLANLWGYTLEQKKAVIERTLICAFGSTAYCGVELIKLITQHFSHNLAVLAELGLLPSQLFPSLARRWQPDALWLR